MMLADLNPGMTMMGVSQVPGHISHGPGHTVYSNTMTGHPAMDKTVSTEYSEHVLSTLLNIVLSSEYCTKK